MVAAILTFLLWRRPATKPAVDTTGLLIIGWSDHVSLRPGDATQFQIGRMVCCGPLQEVVSDIPVRWTIPSWIGTANAQIDEHSGKLSISLSALDGLKFPVIASIDNGKVILTRDVFVYVPERHPLAGGWGELAEIDCRSGTERPFVQANHIQSLFFDPNGSFEVTWFPFEVYKDYWGHYTYDNATQTLTMTVDGGNFFPTNMRLSGRAAIDELGVDELYCQRRRELRLDQIWLGQKVKAERGCGMVFAGYR
jgi:hypothetical protein